MNATVSVPAEGLETRNPVAALVVLLAARFVVTLDLSIVNLALPSIQADFGMSTPAMQWVLSIYALGFGGFLLLAGRAGDLFGARRVMMMGLILVSAASFLGGMAQSATWLIAARTFQGLGAALIAPNAFALTATLYSDPQKRNRAFGISAAVSGIAVTIGGIVGGLLVAGPGWRWVMFVNLPVALLCLAAAPVLLNGGRNAAAGQKLDLWGALTVTAGLIGVVYVIGEGGKTGWLSTETLTVATIAAILLVSFGVIEKRARFPLLRLSVFRDKSLLGGNIAMLIGFPGFVSCLFALTFYLQRGIGLSSVESGIALIPMSLVFLIAAAMAPKMVTRFGPRTLILCGSTAMTAGYLVLCFMGDGDTFLLPFVIGTVLIGCYGLAVPMYFIVATTGLPRSEQGMGSGLLNTSQQIGSGIGIAIMTSLVSAVSSTGPASTLPAAEAVKIVANSPFAFMICAGFLVLSTLAVLLLLPRSRQPQPK